MLKTHCFLATIIVQNIHAVIKLKTVQTPDIIDGEYTTINKFPYAAALFRKPYEMFICGGSVFKPNVVLTAAHCIFDHRTDENGNQYPEKPSNLLIGAGHENYWHTTVIFRDVIKVFSHPCYNMNKVHQDIGLLFLNKEFPIGVIQTVKIVKYWPDSVTTADTYGWGVTSAIRNESQNGDKPVLKFVTMKVYKYRKCCVILKRIANESLNNNMPWTICAGNRHATKKSNKAAQGDSGSGLIINGDTQIGITSFGYKNGGPGISCFTNVSYYYDWLMDHTK